MKIKINKNIAFTAIAILYIGLFIYYIFRPINFDVRLYLGAAYQADLIGSFPTNLFDAWEHKLILNRLLFYAIHKIACIFVLPENITIYEIIVKTIYGIFAVGIIALFTRQTKDFFGKYKISQLIVFSSLYLIVVFSNNMYEMQTEMTGLLLLLIPIMFVLKEKSIYKILAGFFISLLFFLKGVTIAYAIIILAIMLLEKQSMKSILMTIISSFVFLSVEILGICIFRPEEITEFYLSSQYMQQSWQKVGMLSYIISNYINSTFMIIGTISLIFNVKNNIKNKNIKLLAIELMCYATLFLGVFVQKMIITYQLALMIPAFLVSFYIFIYNIKQKNIKIGNIGKIVISTIIVEFIITAFCLNINENRLIEEESNYKINKIQEIYEKYPDIKENDVLYIGNGYSAYYLKIKSYLKYTTTIYLVEYNPAYKHNKYIENIKEKVKEYKGKYIILDDRELKMKRRISNDIIEYIDENYKFIENTGMNCKENQIDDEHVIIYMKEEKTGE
ncbi:MAG: hypothetical protein J6M60_06725 [Clostridia bacterium]|nr:hypothetical protein [Clostridia bacterium]